MSLDPGSPWHRYSVLQRMSDQTTQCGSRERAIDAALDYILANTSPGALPAIDEGQVERVQASAARRYRHRSRLMVLRPPVESKTQHAGDATVELARIERLVTKADLKVLLDCGAGFTDREIATRRGSSPGAVRARLARLRHALAA